MHARISLSITAIVTVALFAGGGCGETLPDATIAPDSDAGPEGADGGSDGRTDADAPSEDCWKRPPVWNDPLPIIGLEGVLNPFVRGDGLLLFGELRQRATSVLVRGVRSDRNQTFALTQVYATSENELWPTAQSSSEAILAEQTALVIASGNADTFTTTSAGITELGSADQWPSLSADGLVLVFYRESGDGQNRELIQTTRTSPSAAFGNPVLLRESTVALPATFAYPALTPDALGLFYKAGNSQRFITRPTKNEPFFTPMSSSESVDTIPLQMTIRSISADGCTLYLSDPSGSLQATRM